MPVRVLWVVKGLGPGGAENLLAIAAELHDPTRFEIECAFVLPHKDHLVGRLEAAGVRTHCVSTRAQDRRWPLRLATLVRRGDYDIVHVHSPLPGSIARLATRAMRRAPRIVATEHNSWGTFSRPTRLINRFTSRWNDATYAVSAEARASIRGRASSSAVALTHGIDLSAVRALTAQREAVRRELAIAPNDVVIGTVANFRAQKDYPNLLRAARVLLDSGASVRWVVVGQGPLEREVRTLASELGLDQVVTFTGFRADATRVMSAFDVFTLASSWEGLPVALMDALALGLPVVATKVGGVAEMMRDGVDALLVPPSDSAALAAAWRRVIESPALTQRLSASAAARSDEFDAGRAVEIIERTYEELAPGRPRASSPLTKTRSSKASGYDIRPASRADRTEILELLRRSMQRPDDPRFADLYAWKHDANPFGPSPTWVATSGGRVVGVRVFMRWEFERGGETIRAVRAVDTATDPDHQGKGLFTALTMHALDDLTADGTAFVFNTPNSQSLPGYLKMGWREVGRLPVAIHPTGVASLSKMLRSRTAADHWSLPLDVGLPFDEWVTDRPSWRVEVETDVRVISTHHTAAFDTWRFGGLADLHYRVVPHRSVEGGAIVVRLRQRGSAREMVHAATFGLGLHEADELSASTARFVGAHHVVRLGSSRTRSTFLPMPGGGPLLAWRALNEVGLPPLPNWHLTMSDIELF